MTTARQLYDREPESVTTDLWHLQSHLPEVCEDYHGFWWNAHSERIQIKILRDHCFDGRRTWSLCTVWFDGQPVMITQNAGREGREHNVRFITDEEKFMEMTDCLRHLYWEMNDRFVGEHINPDANIEYIDTFYGNTLDCPLVQP